MSRTNAALYEDLGVEPSADEVTIRRAYRRKAKVTHPDVPGGNAEAFTRVERAYRVLSSPERRAQYDQTGNPDIQVENEFANALSIIQGAVGQIIQQVIAGNGDLRKTDIMTVVRKQFENNIAQARTNIAAMQKHVDGFEDAAKRFRHKKMADNLLSLMLVDRAKQVRNHIAGVQRDIAELSKCLELLADYEFDFEKPQPQPQPHAQSVFAGLGGGTGAQAAAATATTFIFR